MKKDKYQIVRVGNREFKLKVASVSDAEKDWKLWKTDKKKYYEKFGRQVTKTIEWARVRSYCMSPHDTRLCGYKTTGALFNFSGTLNNIQLEDIYRYER